MNELSERMRGIVAGQGWTDETVMALAMQFIQGRDLDGEFEKYLSDRADEDNQENDDESDDLDSYDGDFEEAFSQVDKVVSPTTRASQGWDVFNVDDGLQVQRDDEAGILKDDDEAAEKARAAGLVLDDDYYVLDASGKRLGTL
jgi:hypothetical protein